MTKRPLGQLTDDELSTFGFVLTNCRGDPVNIEIVSPADGSSDLVEVVDDGVTAFHAELPDGSSSGHQAMQGGARARNRGPAISVILRTRTGSFKLALAQREGVVFLRAHVHYARNREAN